MLMCMSKMNYVLYSKLIFQEQDEPGGSTAFQWIITEVTVAFV